MEGNMGFFSDDQIDPNMIVGTERDDDDTESDSISFEVNGEETSNSPSNNNNNNNNNNDNNNNNNNDNNNNNNNNDNNNDNNNNNDDNDNNNGSTSSKKTKGRKGKRYHRHTPHQIQELESFFGGCAHPDEKQRLDIAKRLGLATRQVKFWFQNRRTQMKTQIERHENVALKQDHDRLRAENTALKEILRNPLCSNCGSPAVVAEGALNEAMLRDENARVKEEIIRVNAIASKYVGKPVSEMALQYLAEKAQPANPNLDIVPVLGNGSSNASVFEKGSSSNTTTITPSPTNGSIMTSDYETKMIFLQSAIAGMEELLTLAQIDGSMMWFSGLEGCRRELLNNDVYAKRFSRFMGCRPFNFAVDATRETTSIFITSSEMVEGVMSPKKWKEMFPCLVKEASTIEVLFPGNHGTRDCELQLMTAEIVFPSPFLPIRQEKFLRYAKKHSEGTWAVVDVSLAAIRDASLPPSTSPSPFQWRRLPSGFIIQDIANGYSLVTWIEHSDYDENCIHHLYQPLIRSGLAYGALRWLATLQREREYVSVLMSSTMLPSDIPIEARLSQEAKKGIIMLMKRVTNGLTSAFCATPTSQWEKVQVGGYTIDVNIMSRASISEPGEPSGVVLSASTSVWMPVPRQHLFDFLRDEKQRSKWDILANGGPMEILSIVPKSHDGINVVSLLCPPAAPQRERNMLVVQEEWSDETSSFLVYAPVDSTSMEAVLKGADSECLALLPSGFAITDGPLQTGVAHFTRNGGSLNSVGASVMSMGFQILVNGIPTSKLTAESVETVNHLVGSTLAKIQASLGIIIN